MRCFAPPGAPRAPRDRTGVGRARLRPHARAALGEATAPADETARFLRQLAQSGALEPRARASNDDVKEHLFTADDWQQHSSVGRFWRHVQTIPTSRTVARVLQPTLFCLAQTTAVCAYDGLRPDGWPALPPVSDAFFSLTGPALALLLVFRTDASYGRWNDARKTLGELIFKSRNLQRQFYTCLPGRQHAALRCQLASWLVAFSAALKLHLRASGGGYGDGGAALRNELAGGWLGDAALDSLAAARHGPNAALAVLSHVVRRAPAADLGALDDNLTHFAEVVGRCERIQRVPIPLSYTRHTSRFLMAWLLVLPFYLCTAVGWDALVFAPLSCFLLFGVDQIGVDLENPFAVLPLDVLADRVKDDAVDLLAGADEAYALAADGAAPGWSGDGDGDDSGGARWHSH